MEKKVINIRRDFSRYPAGRYRSDGPYNGERFREDFLLPALKNSSEKLYVELDGVRGYNSSFLDEAFGGLVSRGINVSDLFDRLVLISQDQSLIEEIKNYIKDREKMTIQP